MSRTAFTEKELKTIARMAPTHTGAEIARKLKRPLSSVYSAIQCRGMPAAKEKYKKAGTGELKKMQALLAEGKSASEIGRQTGLGEPHCSYVIRRYITGARQA